MRRKQVPLIFAVFTALLGGGCASSPDTHSREYTLVPFANSAGMGISVDGVPLLPSPAVAARVAALLRQSGHAERAAAMEAAATRRPAPWTPSAQDIAAVERALGRLFAKPDARLQGLTGPGTPAAPFPLSRYYLRYTGVVLDGRLLIAARGSFDDPAGNTVTFGAGAQAFRTIYDVATEAIVEFSYDAPL
jgi:hypothetical protein